jgi:hypothetical protein
MKKSLLLVLVLFVVCPVFIMAGEVHIGLGANSTWNSGYNSGVGAVARYRTGKTFRLELEGAVSSEMKHLAKEGHTYRTATYLGYKHGSGVFGVGVTHYGYESRFKNGVIWAKSVTTPMIVFGYEPVDTGFEAYLKYLLPEHQTANKLESAILSFAGKTAQFKFMDMWLELRLGFSRVTQSGKRDTSGSVDFYIVMRTR